MPDINDLLSKQKGKAKKMGIQLKKIKRTGPTRPWEKNPAPTTPIKNEKIEKVSPPKKEIKNGLSTAGHKLQSDLPKEEMAGQTQRPVTGQILPSTQRKHLHARQYLLLKLLKKIVGPDQKTIPISYPEIYAKTLIADRTLKRYIAKFEDLGIIAGKNTGWQMDGRQATVFTLNERRLNDYLSDELILHQNLHVGGQNEGPVARHSLSSSSDLYINELSTTTYTKSGLSFSIEDLDATDWSELSLEKLRKIARQFRTLEKAQDFLDRVSYAIVSQKGTQSEIKSPVAFLMKCLKEGVDVDGKYKSRRVRAEEASLAQMEDERRQLREVHARKWKLTFEEWLEKDAACRAKEFEKKFEELHPTSGEYPLPDPIKLKKLREIQAACFILENQVPTHLKEMLLE